MDAATTITCALFGGWGVAFVWVIISGIRNRLKPKPVLVPCRSCGKRVSRHAKLCLRCGDDNPQYGSR